MAPDLAASVKRAISPREQNGRPMKRHRASEDTGANKSGGATRRRAACQQCRLRKIKCDNERPVCASCKATGTSCEYLEDEERLTREKATDILCKRLDSLQQDLTRLHERVEHTGSTAAGTPHHAGGDRNYSIALEQGLTDASESVLSRDYLRIPACRTSADTVLTWDVFDGQYSENSLISALLKTDAVDCESDDFHLSNGLQLPNEEHVPRLVDRFLQNVHTKNPILDVETLVLQARRSAVEGFGWNAWSCLVLIACALGAVAVPFSAQAPADQSPRGSITSMAGAEAVRPGDLQLGESYFVLAGRRLGGLKHTILGTQCHFYAGVYLMYTLRPLMSWQYFMQASTLYQLHMKISNKHPPDMLDTSEVGAQYGDSVTKKQYRLEQSLYWSCFKSESEFRVELPLPQSDMANYELAEMFPPPPSPTIEDPINPATSPQNSAISPSIVRSYSDSMDDVNAEGLTRPNQDIMAMRIHAKQVCNQEESWYYYLTEIALRRIGNRIINSFFVRPPRSWMNVKPLLGIAFEFENQVSSWSAHLPPAMQTWEKTESIRAPTIEGRRQGIDAHVSRELSWAIESRLLEAQSWLYQPFMYYLIHHRDAHNEYARDSSSHNVSSPDPLAAITSGLKSDDAAVLHRMINSGIECNLKILSHRSFKHRHHGLWYDLRSLMCASLILLGIVRSGNEWLIPGGVTPIWGPNFVQRGEIQGLLGEVIDAFSFWAVESPDIARHQEVLQEVLHHTRERYMAVLGS